MGSVGGWVFVVDVTRGLKRRTFLYYRHIIADPKIQSKGKLGIFGGN